MTAQRSTESRNPATGHIAEAGALEALRLVVEEDAYGVRAVQSAIPDLAPLVDAAVARLRLGGRVHYFGAGASGRLALLDATEIPPTYGARADAFVAHFPGGREAILDSTIDFEDEGLSGRTDAAAVTPADVAIGISASGTTPYVHGALGRAAELGAYTALIACAPVEAGRFDATIILDTGPEAVTGSTRLKAGTATKVALNAFSTATMIGLGRTWSNLMVGMSITNDKLRERALRVLQDASGLDERAARAALAAADGELDTAVLASVTGAGVDAARAALGADRDLRRAAAALARS